MTQVDEDYYDTIKHLPMGDRYHAWQAYMATVDRQRDRKRRKQFAAGRIERWAEYSERYSLPRRS